MNDDLKARAAKAYDVLLAKENAGIVPLRESLLLKVADMFGYAMTGEDTFVAWGKNVPSQVTWEGTREVWRAYGTLEIEGVHFILDGEARHSNDGKVGIYLLDLLDVAGRAGTARFAEEFGTEILGRIEDLAGLGKALDVLGKAVAAFGFDPELERLLQEEDAIAKRGHYAAA